MGQRNFKEVRNGLSPNLVPLDCLADSAHSFSSNVNQQGKKQTTNSDDSPQHDGFFLPIRSRPGVLAGCKLPQFTARGRGRTNPRAEQGRGCYPVGESPPLGMVAPRFYDL